MSRKFRYGLIVFLGVIFSVVGIGLIVMWRGSLDVEVPVAVEPSPEEELSNLDLESLVKKLWKEGDEDLLVKALLLQKDRLKEAGRLWLPGALAIETDRCDLLSRLLNEGFSEDSEELLWEKVIEGCKIECAEVLAESGVSPAQSLVRLLVKECPRRDLLAVMLEAGLEINRPDEDGLYPIHYAVVNGAYDLAEYMLERGAELGVRERGVPLLCSVISDELADAKSVQFLLEKGADLNTCTKDLCPIHCAIDVGRLDLIELLLENGASLFSPPPKGRNKFYSFELAAVYGGVKTLDLLLSKLSPKERQELFKTVSFWQALCYRANADVSEDLALLVKKYRLNPNSTIKMEWDREEADVPVVSIIAFSGNMTALKSILDLGGYARVGAENVRPIKFAALGKDVRAVEVLLDRGASPFYVDKARQWNLYHLILNGQDDNEEALVDVIRRLARYSVDVNKRSRTGKTPLMAAIALGRSLEVIRSLIEIGADVNAVDYSGWSVLLYALRFAKDPRVITLLLVKGAKVPESTPDGMPVLSVLRRNPNVSSDWYRHFKNWEKWGLSGKEVRDE